MQKMIGNHMVKSPFVGDIELTLLEALELMKECNIRHLPVTQNDRLVGLVSERDLREVIALPQSSQLKLGDIMKTDLFIAKKTSLLKDVVRTMEEEKIGSVIVVNDRMECVGIFTTIDALGILAEFLEMEDDTSNVIVIEDYIDLWKNAASV